MVQAAAHSVKLRGSVAPDGQGKAAGSRAKSTDKTTKLLIVILVLFLIAEFPQVEMLSPFPTMLNSRRLKIITKGGCFASSDMLKPLCCFFKFDFL